MRLYLFLMIMGYFLKLKKAIDEYIEAKIFKGLTKIGHPKGTFLSNHTK